MIDRIREHPLPRFLGNLRDRLAPHLVRRRALHFALFAILLAIIYWGVVASDRYVSEAVVVVDRTEISGRQDQVDITSVLTGTRNDHDLLLMRDHLLSVDMLQKLDAKLKLRAHFSDTKYDFISRMWFEDAAQEFFHTHYLSRVSVELDNVSGLLRIKCQAYTAVMAQAIANALLAEGEQFMNDIAHRLARDQVDFLEKQVGEMSEQVLKTRLAVIDFQNTKGILSPQAAAETVSVIVAQLEGELTQLKATRAAMLGYLSPSAPDIALFNHKIDAVENQLRVEKGRLTSPKGGTLNRTVEEYQRLEMSAMFAQDIYKTALSALERGRIEATRNLKKVTVVQQPTMPQYPMEPRRIYKIVLFTLCVLVLVGIVQLLAAIIRDHQD